MPSPTPAQAQTGFINRSERHLTLDGVNFRFTGLNIYNANSDGTCGPVVDLDQALSDIGPNKAVMRAWFFQNMATTAGSRDWTKFDQTLATAAAHGVRVIPVLSNQWADCDGGYGFKDKSWYETGYLDPDPGGTISYRDWVGEVVDRYKDNPTVAFWQLINEAEIQNTEGGDCSLVVDAADTLRGWAQDIAGLIKSIDSNHLVSLGTIGGGQCGTQGAEYEYVHSIPEIDLCEYHDYGSPLSPLPGDAFNGFEVRVEQCITNLGKPLFVGEAGIIPGNAGGLQERADAIGAKLEAQLGAGAVGFLAWAYLDPPTSGTFDIGAGDPTLAVLGLDPTVMDGLPAFVVPSPNGRFAEARAVNRDGLVVGGRSFVSAGTLPALAFRWQAPVGGGAVDEDITYLPLPPTSSTPGWALSESVNDLGQVAGSYNDDGDFGLFGFDPSSDSSTSLGSLSPSEVSNAHAINDAGIVVGGSGRQPFMWSETEGIQPLAFVGDRAAATDINSSSSVVGYGRAIPADPFHLLVWDGANPSNPPLDLGAMGGSGVPSVAINNLGQIVAPNGLWTPDGSGGYVNTPVAGTPVDIADNGSIPLVGFDGRLANTDGTVQTLVLSDPAATGVTPKAISSDGRMLLVRVFTHSGPYDAVVDLGPSSSSELVVNDPGDESDTNPGDGLCATSAGTCTLRAAIEETNAATLTSPQPVAFSISSPIRPTTPLPTLSAPAILDGTTSGCDGTSPGVELDGSLLGALTDGLVLTAGNTTVRGLLVHSFPGSGIEITGPGGNLIECNFIGTDGNLDLGNGFGVSIHGSPNNYIGGTGDSGNLISGNNGTGVTIRNAGADGNTLQGNRFGTNRDGDAAVANDIGVFVTTGATNTLIGGDGAGQGNLIAGNTHQGISVVSSSTTGTSILGNLIGTDASGSTALSNEYGVSTEATDTWIGDGSETGRNIISGQSQHGITVAGTATGTRILGNYIGADRDGTAAVPNRSGIWIAQTSQTTVGGSLAGEGNLISGNSLAGIQLVLSAHENVIVGNRIGAGVNGETSGAAALGNGAYGVILDNAVDNTIGGADTGDGNVIAQAGGAGVASIGGSGNLILGNSISDNAGLGIDHADDGVSTNSGPGSTPADNETDGILNHPTLTAATTDGSTTEVTGELRNTVPNAVYRVEVFTNNACDPSGHGEGAAQAGSADVSSDSTGNAMFSFILPIAINVGDVVTATATLGGLGTSEFSACVIAGPADATDATPPNLIVPGDRTVIAQSSSGTAVTFEATAIDDVDGEVPVDCSPSSGSVFAIGTTEVSCSARHASGNTATETFLVNVVYGSADMSITKTDNQDPIIIGDTILWTITLSNSGPDSAINVTMSDALPPGVTYLTANAPGGTCTHASGVVQCGFGAIQPGGSVTVTIAASTDALSPSTTSVLNLASVTAATTDSDESNNSDSETTGVTVPALNACQQPDDGSPRTWAFGTNNGGSLGTGLSGNTSIPMTVTGVNSVVDVETGSGSSILQLADGTLCGSGWSTALGFGGFVPNLRPVPLPISAVSQISAGSCHHLAVVDGDVWGFGCNGRGQAGLSSSPNRIPVIPGDVSDPTFVAVSAGRVHGLALTDDGRVYSLGANEGAGRLGDGSANGPPIQRGYLQPVSILPTDVAVAKIAAGASGNFVLLETGQLLYWGIGSQTTPRVLEPLGGWPSSIVQLESGSNGGGVVVRDSAGRVWTWNAPKGDGSAQPAFDASNPVTVASISDATAIAYGDATVLARRADGSLWGWGDNFAGQLDNGSTTRTVLTPIPIGNLIPTNLFDTSGWHTVVLGTVTPGALIHVDGAVSARFPDGTVYATTDDDGDAGASPYDPIETTAQFHVQDEIGVGYFNNLTLYITETPVGTTAVPVGFEILGYQVQIVDNKAEPAPTPWTITFRIQLSESQLELGQDYIDGILVQRDGTAVGPCDGSTDPCVLSRSISGDDAVLTIVSTDFSLWTFAVPTPEADAGGPYLVEEGADVELDGTGSTSPYGDHSALLFQWLAPVSDVNTPTPVFTGGDDFSGDVTLIVTHPAGGTAIDVAHLTVANVPPVISAIIGPDEPVAVGQQVSLTVQFDDPGALDTHQVSADFGDGNSGVGTVHQPSRTGILSHTYEQPGVYRVEVTIEDDDGGAVTESYEFVVAYDPNGGFVTGGGWIESPPGAYVQEPEVAGRANFGFVSKYKRGRSVPEGNTEFQFKAADLHFVSTQYEWLVIAGAQAQFKGSGTINGGGDYGFLLTAVDGQLLGPTKPDRFRIKIWDRDSGMVVYDNQLGDPDESQPVTELEGGAIVIHSGR